MARRKAGWPGMLAFTVDESRLEGYPAYGTVILGDGIYPDGNKESSIAVLA
jgi:hypothetical protein